MRAEPARSGDPFTGEWGLDAARSKLSAMPQQWIQRIEVMGEEITVREEIVRAGQPSAIVSVQAKFDGNEYAVKGSPIVETIAYTRVNEREIRGIGRKDGNVCLREVVVLSDGGRTFTQTFSVFSGDREIANGVAVFEKM